MHKHTKEKKNNNKRASSKICKEKKSAKILGIISAVVSILTSWGVL